MRCDTFDSFVYALKAFYDLEEQRLVDGAPAEIAEAHRIIGECWIEWEAGVDREEGLERGMFVACREPEFVQKCLPDSPKGGLKCQIKLRCGCECTLMNYQGSR